MKWMLALVAMLQGGMAWDVLIKGVEYTNGGTGMHPYAACGFVLCAYLTTVGLCWLALGGASDGER